MGFLFCFSIYHVVDDDDDDDQELDGNFEVPKSFKFIMIMKLLSGGEWYYW
jgi:hypothetical protein